MSALTRLQNGISVGDVVYIQRQTPIQYGIVVEIDNSRPRNVRVQSLEFSEDVYWQYGIDLLKLTEERVNSRRQQLVSEMELLEQAWKRVKSH